MRKQYDEFDNKLRRLWDEGHSTAEIGRRLGVTANSVIGRAHRLFLPSRPSPIKINAERRKAVQEMRDAGASVPAIAKALGCRQQEINYILFGPKKPLQNYIAPILPKLPSLAAVELAKVATIKAQEQQVLRLPKTGLPTCQWIENDARPWRFCGCAATRGSWCEKHRDIVFTKNTKEAA